MKPIIPGFGKHFESMYEGSMVGAGSIAFAVMGYVIAKGRPVGEIGSQVMMVELNPELLAFILGERDSGGEQRVIEAIKFLCAPDPKSRSKESEGRRLIKTGQFEYQVVNGMKYRAVPDPEKRKEQNRVNQANFRARKKSQPMPMENAAVRAFENGDTQRAEEIAGRQVEKKPVDRPIVFDRPDVGYPVQNMVSTTKTCQSCGRDTNGDALCSICKGDDEDFSGLTGA